MARLPSILSLLVLFLPGAALAQTAPTLTITSPGSGLVIQPGQTIIVDVSGTNPPAGSKEGLIITDPIPYPLTQDAASNIKFQVAIPANINPGSYSITAVESAPGSPNGLVVSAPLIVKVLPNYHFDTLNADVRTVMITSRAESEIPLVVSGSTNGISQMVSNQFLTFNSANPAIATVDANGIITPKMPGQTKVTFSYGAVTGSVDVIIGPGFAN